MVPTLPTTGEPPRRRHWRPDPLPLAAAVLLTVALIRWLPRPLGSDVAGQLWLAHALRGGARLYVDIAEINPPLWFWLAMPVDWLAEAARVDPAPILIAAFGAATLASLAATDRLIGPMPPRRRSALLLYAAAILLVMPLRDFAQREVLALLAAVSYAALAAARRTGRPVSRWHALFVGAGAAIGFALKHYFLGVPVLLELWLFSALRRGWRPWRPWRPETLALVCVGAGYAMAVLAVTPTYLTGVVPTLRLAYGAGGASWRQMVLPAQMTWLMTALAIASQHRVLRAGRTPVAAALLISAAAFGVGWLVQHKGWPYHAIPATGTLALALAALLAEAGDRVSDAGRRLAVAALPLPILVALMPTHAALTGANAIAPALAGLRAGETIGLISTEGFTAWPTITDRRLRLGSRYGQYWMLGAIDADAAGARDPRMAQFGRDVVRETVEDYRCLPPIRIIIARPGPSGSAAGDPLAFFRQDPAFAQLIAHYRYRGRDGIFDSWQRVTRPAMPRTSCRRAP